MAFYYPTVRAGIGEDAEAAEKYAQRYGTVSVSESYSEYIHELLLKTDKLQVFNGELKTGMSAEAGSHFYLEIDKEAGKAMSDVEALCLFTKINSDGTQTVYELGTLDVQSDWDNMRFEEHFDGTWESVGGQFCTCTKYDYGSEFAVYLLPVIIEDNDFISLMQLMALKNDPENAFLISVMDMSADGETVNRTYMPEGVLTFSTILCETENNTSYICNSPVTIEPCRRLRSYGGTERYGA